MSVLLLGPQQPAVFDDGEGDVAILNPANQAERSQDGSVAGCCGLILPIWAQLQTVNAGS